jgi:hypothetical protein
MFKVSTMDFEDHLSMTQFISQDFERHFGGRFEIFMVSWDNLWLDGAWVLTRLDLLVLTIIMFFFACFQ